MTIRKDALGLFASALAAVLAPSECRAQTKDGAVLGGVAGAVIGGIIGHQNDETPEGALLGGAVGAVAGGIFGKQQEQQRQIQYYQQQAYLNHHPAPVYTTHVHPAPVYTSTVRATPVRRPVSVSDVITLSRSGISETVIVNQIQASGVAYQPNTDDVLTMHDAGVCDHVIAAMQNAPVGETVVVSPTPIAPRQVIVHEEYQPSTVYVTRPIYQSSPAYYHPAHGHPAHLHASPYYRRRF